MSTTETRSKLRAGLKSSAIGAALAFLFAHGAAQAQVTDLATAPLASGSAVQIKPNIMFILDASGSMGDLFLPDAVGGTTSSVGFRNSQCNYIYYNPNVTYLPPKKDDGTNFPNQSFTGAQNDGFESYEGKSITSVDLSGNNFTATGSGSGQPAYYYTYSGTQTLTPMSAVCTQSLGSGSSFPATGGGTWTKVVVSATSGPSSSDERQNFANWYSYYRKRIYMAKTAASRAFDAVNDHYRVGFITILPMSGSSVSSSKFLKIGDFGGTQRTNWYSKLFAQQTGNSTPLREALARVGRYYAGKNDGINAGMIPTQADDPVQYSCQQNFSILTTDGQWNTGDETVGPVQLNGTTLVGQQDGNISVAPRPMYDGATTVQTLIDKWNEYRYSTSGCSGSRQRVQYRTWTVTTNLDPSTGNPIGTPSANSTSYNLGNWYDSSCKTSGSLVSLPPNNASPVPPQISQTSGHTYRRADPNYPAGGYNGNFEQPAPTAPCTAWPCTGAVTSTGGSTNSLADVAQYYYNTDLRPTGSIGGLGSDVSKDNVRHKTATSVEDDQVDWQHMTTFTMGLGLAGTLKYSPTYKTDTTGDFASIRAGTLNWPIPSATTNGGPPENVDDLWHAGVDGRGLFFSANNPDEVVNGLTTALQQVTAVTASAAAAATSNLEPVAGDNFAYTAKYTTQEWWGELEAHEIDLANGTVNPTAIWSAAAILDKMTGAACDNRTIRLFRAGASNNLVDFTANTQKCDASGSPTGAADSSLNASELANFGTLQATALSQGMDASQQAAAAGANFVNYVRGQRGKELFVTGDVNHLFRGRVHILGDIVNAQPVFVRGAIGSYGDTGYAAYKTAQASRTPIVYVAANDGMLHAFYAGTSATDPQGGTEAWAFIPTSVLPELYKLADTNYADLHIYTVDGTPATGDVFDSAAGVWKTIIVGGLNGGGRGYYALDITNPLNPVGLWEFKNDPSCYPANSFGDCDLGYSFGNPLIAKLTDGTWAVFVTTGYNNASGVGALYVLDAMTGKIIYKISTGVGSAGTPSGLNKIAGWADDPLVNNTAQRIYGVDVLGNIWRFDVNDILGPAGREAELLATAKDPSGNPQPITTKPELGLAGSPAMPFVFVATGRYLGTSDLPAPPAVPQTQSVYAIQDALSMTPIANLRTTLKQNTITTTTVTDPNTGVTSTIRQTSCTNNCTSAAGWFADLPESGERANVDPKLQLGTLVVPTNVPENNSCSVGGHSWINFFNYSDGLAVSSSANASVGQYLSDSLAVGINVVRLPGGKTVVIATTSDAKQQTVEAPFAGAGLSGKRVSWRELVQ